MAAAPSTSPAAPAAAAAAPSTDLTARLLPHLDRHLVLPLLDFLESRGSYSHQEVLQAKYDLLKPTNMVTYVLGLKREMEGQGDDAEVPEEFRTKEKAVLATLGELEAQAHSVMNVISNPEVVSALRQDKLHNLAYLKDNHGVTLDQIALLYRFGQFQYSIGQYSAASDYFYHFRVLSTDSNLVLSSMWGKLASDVLEGSWDAAMEELSGLREQIDQRGGAGPGGPLLALQQRTWWLHWSLFVYYNHPTGRDALLENWLNQNYLNTIQTSCPWLLRYLVAAVVVSRKSTLRSSAAGNSARSREAVRDVVRALTQEEYQYKDPITEFLRKLYGEVDFEGAREEMEKAALVMEDDFFLEQFRDDFVENARYLVSEAYCRIHHRIDIGELSDRLGMTREEGERWVVDLVRDAKLDAKIDFKENTVQMNHAETPVYQSVIERSKGLLFRAQAMASAIEIRAAVAWEAGKPLSLETITVDPPRKDEVRIKILFTGLCHTDVFTLSGDDPEGAFPVVLGHEGGGVVESIGEGVTDVKVGDHVVPLYTAECRKCKFCLSGKTNLCGAVRATQGRGLMPDETSRFKCKGQSLLHFMGCSTFSEYTVVSKYSVVTVTDKAPLDKACLLGCGLTTGYGAATKTANVQEGETVAIFGLGAVGLAVVQGAVSRKASRVIAVDTNDNKESWANKFGATEFVNPMKLPKGTTIVDHLVKITDGGLDHTFDCTGNVMVMRQALEACHKGWGTSTIIGVAAAGKEISTRPFQLVTGRKWQGSAFGGVKGRTELPGLVDDYLAGKLTVDDYITHSSTLTEINKGFEMMKTGDCIRCVVDMTK